MVSRSKDKASGDGAVEWIDEELRETKARLHRVESELAQALKQTYSLEAEVQRVVETLAATGSVEATLQAFREEVRQLRDQMGKVQDRQSAVNSKVEQVVTQRQSESSRDRQDIGAIVKQVEALNRALEQNDGRMKALEEIARHIEEEVAGHRLTGQALERNMEEVVTRNARTHEATLRLDQETARYTGQIEELEKSDEALADRMTLFLDQLRRVIERLDKMEALSTSMEAFDEAQKQAAFEREQLSQRAAQAERVIAEIMESVAGLSEAIARVDQRTQHHGGEIVRLNTDLQDLDERVTAGLKKVYQTLLRQRKRGSEALNQEIKELTQGELHAGD